jgi:hypothetical protein
MPVGENAPLDRLAECGGLALLQLLHLIEALDEDQVGDLLDHLQRVGEPARPEVVPDAVDLVAQFACQHSPSRLCATVSTPEVIIVVRGALARLIVISGAPAQIKPSMGTSANPHVTKPRTPMSRMARPDVP